MAKRRFVRDVIGVFNSNVFSIIAGLLASIIQLILPGIIMVVIFRILSGHLAGLGMPQIILYIFLPALVLNILLNLLWIPQYGGVGAAMATNVSYTAGSIGYMIAYTFILKVPLKDILIFKKSDFTQLGQLIRELKK